MLDNTLLILFPFVNIDGYYLYQKLVEENASKKEKENYRKNLNKYGNCAYDWQYGVDINRNFDSAWGSLRTSDIECGEEFRGPKPFSEKESRAIRTLFTKFKITLAIDIHSYGNQWIYPYASETTNEKFEKHELYPLYTDLFEEFNKLKRPMKGCFDSLGYTADGVYIDWALDQGALSLAVEIGKSFDGDVDIGNEILFETEELFHTVLRKNSISYKKYRTKTDNSLAIKSTSLLSFDVEVLLSNGTSLGVKRLPSREAVVYKLNQETKGEVTLKIIDTKIEEKLDLSTLEMIESADEIMQSPYNSMLNKNSVLSEFNAVTIILISASIIVLTIIFIKCCCNNKNKNKQIPKMTNIDLKESESQPETEESDVFIVNSR